MVGSAIRWRKLGSGPGTSTSDVREDSTGSLLNVLSLAAAGAGGRGVLLLAANANPKQALSAFGATEAPLTSFHPTSQPG